MDHDECEKDLAAIVEGIKYTTHFITRFREVFKFLSEETRKSAEREADIIEGNLTHLKKMRDSLENQISGG
jgi:hypothetical protein